jgi:hypothetical protein
MKLIRKTQLLPLGFTKPMIWQDIQSLHVGQAGDEAGRSL